VTILRTGVEALPLEPAAHHPILIAPQLGSHEGPKEFSVIRYEQMQQLVHDDLLAKPNWRLQQISAEGEALFDRARSPL
jgi:hypothetical protein